MSDEPTFGGLTIAAYAVIERELMREPREEVLTRHGLTEEAFSRAEDEFQKALDLAIDAAEDGVPPLLVAYDQAMRTAKPVQAAPPLDLPTFVRATMAMRSGTDPQKSLERLSVTLPAYLAATEYWSPRLATDADLAAEFARLMTGR